MGKQRFSLQFDFEGNIGPIKSSIQELQKSLSGITLPPNLTGNFEKLFGKLEKEMSDFEAITKNGFSNMADVNKAQTAFSRISKLMNQLENEASKVKGIDINKLIPKEAQNRVDGLKKKWQELDNQSKKKDGFADKIEKQNKAIKQQRALLEGLKAQKEALSKENSSLGAAKGTESAKKKSAEQDSAKVLGKMQSLEGQKGGKSSAEYKALGQELTRLNSVIKNCDSEMARLTTQINKNKTAIGGLEGEIGQSDIELKNLEKDLQDMQKIQVSPEGLLQLRQELAQLTGLNLDQVSADLDEIKLAIDGINNPAIEKVSQNLRQVENASEKTTDALQNAKGGMQNFVDSAGGLDRAAQDMQNLQNQVYQFFSLTNSVQLFKRAVLSALDTVKELDATMTEAAVVTEFSVGDMWDKLPQYSKNAQQLGVSINGMYQATTLYYQQGLKNNEAMQLGIETMKMAKIAGMESTQATEAMTAALRGFNMELNETSAVRVNDVYSQLAAVTAADTEQIATAMSKTASIAASANMEFETTAALLAQIIETTQEAPETAGTAMKTIIARFSEVKDLKAKGQTTGQDSEGEAIDVNKIQTALRTVGIDMEGFFSGTKGLDSILLELAGKWDTLDFETQRYIATMAAGSRQQSRFIAMMSDYKRTTELVGEANNSAGASQAQFNKTLESMESKMQRLKNAWDQFLMGLSNNEILKFGVDLLAGFLETINKLVDGISGGNGLIKSVTSLVAVIGTMKMGKSFLSGTGVGGIFSRITGQGATKETITETKNEETGEIVRTVVKEPLKQGEAAGKEAGTGFLAGFKRAVQAGKTDGNIVKSFMTTGPSTTKIDGKDFGGSNKRLIQKRQNSSAKTDFLAQAYDQNQESLGSAKNLEGVSQAFDDVISKGGTLKEAADAANVELEKLGGTSVEVGEDFLQTDSKLQNMNLDMKAMGQASMGVGAALGGLSAIFSSMGLDGAAKAVSVFAGAFMGLGTVMSTLSTIAPMLGMSFTTAGVQITTAGVTSQLAWWWVFVIIGAIAALIILFAVLAKKAKAASLEGRMEAAAKATEEAKKAAEEAKQAYEDLLSDKSEYDEIQNKLAELTKGTQEWKQALIEANDQVLELIQTYPQLAEYLEAGEDGQLKIAQEGFEKLTNDAEKKSQNSQNQVLFSQLQETVLKTEKSRADAISNLIREDNNLTDFWTYNVDEGVKDLYGNTQYTEKQGSLSSAFDYLYSQYENDPNFLSVSNLEDKEQELFNTIGLTKEQIISMIPSLQKYSNELKKNEILLENQSKALLSGYVSEDVKQYEYGEEILEGVTKGFVANQQKIIGDTKEKLKKEEGVQSYGLSKGLTEAQMSGNKNSDLQQIYAKMAGLSSVDQIDESLRSNNDKLIEEIANLEAATTAGAHADKMYDSLKKLGKDEQRIYAAALAKDTKNISEKDLDFLTNLDTAAMATKMGYGSETEMALALGYKNEAGEADVELMKNSMAEIGEKAVQEFNKISERATQMGLDQSQLQKDYLENTTVGQLTAYTDLMTQALGTMGKEGASAFQNNFDSIMESASAEQQEQILNALGTFDFTNEADAQQFISFLNDIGISLPTDQAEAFEGELKSLSDAFKKIDVSNLRNQIKELLDLADSIGSRESSEGVSQEEYDKLIANGIASASDFMWTGQEWVYVTGPMEKLQKAIEDNTAAINQKTREELEGQIEKGERVAKAVNNAGENINYARYTGQGPIGMSYGTVNKEEFLSGKTTDVEAIRTILGLSGDLTDAEVLSYYKSSLDSYGKLAENKTSLSTLNNQSESSLNLDKTTTTSDPTNEKGKTELVALARYYGVAEGTIKQFEKSLTSANKAEKDAAILSFRNTIEQKRQEKQYGQTLKKLSEVNEKYKDVATESEAIHNYGESLGIDTSIADNYSFVASNMALIQQAAEGDIQSLLLLDKMLAQQYGFSISADGNFDLLNFELEKAKEGTKEFIESQVEAGNYIPVQVKAETQFSYFKPSYDDQGNFNGFTQETAEAGQVITMLKPKNETFVAQAQKVGGVSSGGQQKEKWENPYDKQYNKIAKINQELRQREKIERRYQALLKKDGVTAAEIVANSKEALENLKQEKELREQLIQAKKQELTSTASEYSDLKQYAYLETNPYTGDQEVRINYELINQVQDQDKGERIEEYISKLEELVGVIQDERDAIDNIDDTTEEIKSRGKDQYFSFEERIKDALISEREREIEKLQEINETINDTNSKIIDSIQQQIEEVRQARDNQKTEEEIANDERKLLYLQQDTSGANALDILKLQEQLDEKKQSYTDTLIDQKISALQEQNDEAAEQRERQIAILEEQKQQWIESGKIWGDVYNLLNSGTDGTGKLLSKSDLANLLQSEENFAGLSAIGQMEWFNELELQIAQAISYLKSNRQLEDLGLEGKTITFKTKDNKDLSGVVNSDGSVTVNGKTYKDIYQGADGKYYTDENFQGSTGNISGGGSGSGKVAPQITEADKLGVSKAIINGNYGWGKGAERKRKLAEVFGADNDIQANYVTPRRFAGNAANYSYQKMYEKFVAFKSGGLADFTGPAWLDGTKSKPEYILNADQTKAFFRLVDVLSSLQGGASKSSQNYGDNTFDIDINVESIGSDYDVEQVAEKVKRLINSDARYRNNNTVNLMR